MNDKGDARAKQRAEDNARIRDAVKNGAPIPALIDQQSRFFPPRPFIKKDLCEIERALGAAREEVHQELKKTSRESRLRLVEE